MKKHNHKKGFTLIELLIVISIIGLLLLVALPNYLKIHKIASNKIGSYELDENNKKIYKDKDSIGYKANHIKYNDKDLDKEDTILKILESNKIEPNLKPGYKPDGSDQEINPGTKPIEPPKPIKPIEPPKPIEPDGSDQQNNNSPGTGSPGTGSPGSSIIGSNNDTIRQYLNNNAGLNQFYFNTSILEYSDKYVVVRGYYNDYEYHGFRIYYSNGRLTHHFRIE